MTADPPPSFRRPPLLVATVGVAILYYLAARVGLARSFEATPVWPAAGIAAGAMLLVGPGVWPGVWLGAFVANFISFSRHTTMGIPLVTLVTALIAAGNTLEAVVFRHLVRLWLRNVRAGVHADLQDGILRGETGAFEFGLLAIAASVTSALVGPVTICTFSGKWPEFWSMFAVWLAGDATGIFVVAPALLSIIKLDRSQIGPGGHVEGVISFLLLITLGWLILGGTFGPEGRSFTLVVPMAWISLRLCARSTYLALLILSGMAAWFSSHNVGPLAAGDPTESVVVLLSYLWVVGLMSLTVAGSVSARRRVEATLRDANEQLGAAMAAIPAIVFVAHDPFCRRITGNAAASELLGVPTDSNLSASNSETREDRSFIERTDSQLIPAENLPMQRAARLGRPVLGEQLDLEFKDGRIVRLYGHAVPLFDAGGSVRGCIAAYIDISDRIDAERTQARLAAIVESSSDPIISETREGIIETWNDAAEEMFGWKASEIIGKHISRIVPAAEMEKERDIRNRIDGTDGGVTHYETVRVAKDGRHIPVFLTLSPIRDRHGRVAGISKIIHDITGRKRTEQELAEQARLLDLSSDAIIVRDRDDCIVYWNRGAEQLYGWSQAEAKGQLIHEFLGTQFPAPLDQIRARLTREGRWSGELIHRRRDGTELTVATRWIADPREHSTDAFVLETNTDISERKKSEQALRKSEERFRLLASNAPVGIFMTAADGRTVYVNEAWCSFSACSSEQALGDDWLHAVHPDDREWLFTQWKDSVTAGKECGAEYRFQHPDGKIVYVQGHAVPFYNTDGKPEGYIGTIADITERRESEQALRKSEERFRLLAESAPVGIFMTRAGGQLMYVNATWRSITGLGDEQARDFEWVQAVHPEDRDKLMADFKRSREAGAVTDDEFRIVRPDDGRTLHVHGRGLPYYLPDGQIGGYIGTLTDVTQRLEAERALRDSEELLRSITDQSGDLIFVKDRQSRIIFVNPAGLRVTGFQLQDMLGRHDLELYPDHPEVAASFIEGDRRVMLSRTAETVEENLITLRGEHRTLLTTKTPRLDPRGQVIGVIGIARDITERKAAEEAIRQSELRYRSLFENSIDAMFTLDLSGRLLSGNPAALALTGYTHDEFTRLTFQEFCLPEYLERTTAAFVANLHGAKQEIETAISRKDGSRVDIFVSGTPIWVETHVVGVFGIAHDITERKRAEEDLRRLNEELEQRIAARTTELRTANSGLRSEIAARRRLEQQILGVAEREQRRLGENLHESLGSQLAGVIFLVGVHAKKLKATRHPQASVAAELVTLLQQSLDTTRHMARNFYPVELETGGLLTAVQALCDRTTRMLQLSCVLEANHRASFCDRPEDAIHLYRIIQEAITNAIKHARCQHITVTCTATPGHETVTIADDGTGFQPPAPGARKNGSNSMGLSLMGYRARVIGGEITIGRSQTGGCLVTFTRPIDEGPDCDPEDLERPDLENAAEPELPLRFDGSPPPADR